MEREQSDHPRYQYGEWTSIQAGEGHALPEFHFEAKLGRVAARTDTGGPRSKYSKNEDAMFTLATSRSLVVGVIDGAGGSGNGKLAAELGALNFARGFREGQSFEDALELGDRAICDAPWPSEYQRGYATGVLAQIGSPEKTNQVTIGYAGDAKALTIREGQKLDAGTTKFQNIAQTKIDQGFAPPEGYYNHPQNHIITGGFGIPDDRRRLPQIMEFAGQPGDLLVMASDGLWDNVSEFEIIELAKVHRDAASLQQALFALAYERNNSEAPFIIRHDGDTKIEKKLQAGDNITVVVVELTNLG